MEQQRPAIFQGSFGLGCLFLHKLQRVKLVVLVEKDPWVMDVFKSFSKTLLISLVFLLSSKRSRVVFLIAGDFLYSTRGKSSHIGLRQTACRHDITFNVDREFLNVLTYW